MERIRAKVHHMVGKIYIPKYIMECKEEKLLHISDTPVMTFSPIKRLVERLSPKYIIHTGDLVDNIKLEMYPYKLKEYQSRVSTIIRLMESSSAEEIYITLGNHDNEDIVTHASRRSIILGDSFTLQINNLDMKISHYPDKILNNPGKYNFFGHDITLPSRLDSDKIFLNGIQNINIVTLSSQQIFTLPYPLGTDDSRLCRSKIGF